MIDPNHLPRIAGITASVAFGVYRRVRRNIGRQPLTASYYIVHCTGLLQWLRKVQHTAGARLAAGAPDGAPSTSV